MQHDNSETTDIRSLIDEANRLLDENEFAAARDTFRAAAIQAAPTRPLLGNLNVAEQQERLQFSRILGEKHPNSLIAQLEQIALLMSMGDQWTAHAVVRCSELLQTIGLDTLETHHIQRLRFRAASQTVYGSMPDPYRTLVEDFTEVWRAGEIYAWAVQPRTGMLQEIASMNEPEVIPVLGVLAQQEWLPLNTRKFLETKISELEALKEATQEYS